MKSTLKVCLTIFLLIILVTSLYPSVHKINSVNIEKRNYYPLYKILNLFRLERYYDTYTRKTIIKDKGRYLTFLMDENVVYYQMQTVLLKAPPLRHKGVIYIPREMVDLISVWKRGGFHYKYNGNDFLIEPKKEVFYPGDKESSARPAPSGPVINRDDQKGDNKGKEKGKEKVKSGRNRSAKIVDNSKQKKTASRIRVIIIDPGHGGADPGAIGQKGVREKDVVLKTCLYLRDYLKKKTKGIKIVMTREKDVFIPLGDRATIANKYINKNTAGIFLSVHANASHHKKTRGTETFVLSPIASDDNARAVAAMENGKIDRKTEKIDSISKILSHMITDEYIRESIQLAEFIQKSYSKNLKAKSTTPTGVKKALFYVLEGTMMPAVLTEIGFLTNLLDEKLLKKDSYQKNIAISIRDGLIKYINWYEAHNGFIQ
jgi:N-acetylmuramoyl-L-alanine amidase